MDEDLGTPPKLPQHNEQSASGVRSTIGALPMRRLDFVTIELMKEPGFTTLGMEVNQLDDSSLRIESIDEHGLVGWHNARQESELSQILVGDCIVEVNGVRSEAGLMLHECKVKQHLSIVLSRDVMGIGGMGWDTQGITGSRSHVSSADELAKGGSPVASTSLPLVVLGPRLLSSGHRADEQSATDVGGAGSSPSGGQLRPDAQVFVPSSAQKEAAVPVFAPPGLAPLRDIAEPNLQAVATPADGSESKEVKRALFR